VLFTIEAVTIGLRIHVTRDISDDDEIVVRVESTIETDNIFISELRESGARHTTVSFEMAADALYKTTLPWLPSKRQKMSQSTLEHVNAAFEERVNSVDEFKNTTLGETDTIFTGDM
jgi:hypothetical protein